MRRIPFHPLVRRWFAETFAAPTPVQMEGWERIAAGGDTLIAAPTGSGKTLAAFLWAVNRLVAAGAAGRLEDRIHVVYVSPLKALGNDIEKNLRQPLASLRQMAESEGLPLPEMRVAVRTGDTPARQRQLQLRTPPHILITTPESLYILLTAERSRQALRCAETVIVDEIHAVAADKRGAHLALSLERLEALAEGRLQRIGLSATQRPVEEVARLLVGAGRCRDGTPDCAIVDAGHRREMELRVEVPEMELGAIPTHEMQGETYDRIASLVRSHRATIVFAHTRRMVERVAHALSERLGSEQVAAHHGSLSRETRLAAEAGLKCGRLPVIVASASLELGIDVGYVDLVCHLGAPRSLASMLQRVGRSGHFLGATPRGVLLPLTRDDLLQCAAAVRAARAGELDRLEIPENPRDILGQQMVAIAASGEVAVDDLWNLVRRAHPFRRLPRGEFDAVLEMLAEGVSTRRGRRSAHLHYDRVNGVLRARRGARLAAITSGGAIPDTADYDVLEEPSNAFVGKVNEDFAVESLAGDVFLLGNRPWRIRRVESGRIRVEDARGAAPTIPFWLGEAPARTRELSAAVADLRREVVARAADPQSAAAWLVAETGVDSWGAEQIVTYLAATAAVLGAVPTLDTVVAERFFDEAGGMQLILHAPFGGRINRALGLALRKRFCVQFDFELQAAATDDGVVLSLGEQHSFPLENVFSMLRPERLHADLTQAALVAPMFANRWRWNASRALALLRHSGGRRVPMPIQRMRAEDLLAAVFPAQLACGDNHVGPVELPDHPLVNETIDNCLHEAMDIDGLAEVLASIGSGRIRTRAVETPAPSPMSHEILNANPYAFLDDAPLEERRARAVALRRTIPDLADGVGALDPQAIEEVRRQAWPDARDADEVHDALLTLCVLPVADAAEWKDHLDALISGGRVNLVDVGAVAPAYVAAERQGLVRAAFGLSDSGDPGRRGHGVLLPHPLAGEGQGEGADLSEPLSREQCGRGDPRSQPLHKSSPSPCLSEEEALVTIVRGWMESLGPITAASLAARLSLAAVRMDAALARLEADGVVLQGRFTAGTPESEWCERRLLARIHRLTIGRLRREIEPVSAADFMRFLFRWQHLQPGAKLHGREGVRAVIEQLQGLELPAPAWERDVLPARIADYDPADLEHLCLSGEVTWGRLAVTASGENDEAAPGSAGLRHAARGTPTRSAPLAFVLRSELPHLLDGSAAGDDWRAGLSSIALEVHGMLQRCGASFLGEIAVALGRRDADVEQGLWELVARGLATGDGLAGLRLLLDPEDRRRARRGAQVRVVTARRRPIPVGRWALLRLQGPESRAEDRVERAARRLLGRYGVVFRELCARERREPRWRDLLRVLRRLEARGEIRGGRFVAGFLGEQFALPHAVEALRGVRRRAAEEEIVCVGASDPLNLLGIVLPGSRLSPFATQAITYRNGVPIGLGELADAS